MTRPLSRHCKVPLTQRQKRLGGPGRQLPTLPDKAAAERLVGNLRQYQAELEIQNRALRFSQAAAEGASERFVTLFSHVPLALMVVEESGLVLETNGRALDLFRPLERDPPLTYLHPLVNPNCVDRVRLGFLLAKEQGAYELDELEFTGGSNGLFAGDLHIARINDGLSEQPRFICAVIDQGPLLAQRHALQVSANELQQRNEQLLQSQTRLAAIINSSLDAIVCVDRDHRISVFNPTAATLFQCPTEQALGRALTDFLPDAARALSYKDITSHAQLGEMTGLTSQGDNVAGGAYDYVTNANMIGGFALIAWPARYAETGVITFVINNAGILYEADFGPETEKTVEGIKSFNPDDSWSLVED